MLFITKWPAHCECCFKRFNPLKSTQRGSDADRTDDFPPKPWYPTKTYFTKGVSHFSVGGRGGGAGATTQWSTSQLNNRHHENLTPENGVTQFTEQLQHTKPPPLRRCGSVFTGTTRQTGQQLGLREGKTGHQVTHSQHEHRKQRRHSISAPLWGARAGVFLKHTEAFFIRSLRSSL